MATNPPGENITKITGRVRTRGTGQAIFGARVRLSGHRRGTTTDENGDFALSVPTRVLGSSATFYILMTDMWPRRVVVPITGELIQLTGEQCTLDPIGTFWTKHIVGQAAALFGPKLVMFWYGSTARERILYCVVLVTGIIPVFLAAIDAGLPLPLTDFDEVIRESLQRTIALPWERGPVRFSKIRRTYHAKVNYVIPSSQYKVEGDVLIWKGAKVTIEPGSRFLMGPHAGFRIEGLLNAEGESEQPITFGRANPQMSWSNLTFWGQGSVKSRLKYCVIEGGAGRPCSSATEGNVYDDPNGSRKGGGLLLYDTYISVENTQIINCRADAGGGIYQRNALTPDAGAALPGSSFKSVIVTKCFAKAGGGAVFAQRCYPEFAKCSFEENGADGRNSCGGAVYMGLESRAKFTDCTFSHNTANAEGGAIYALQCYAGGSEQL